MMNLEVSTEIPPPPLPWAGRCLEQLLLLLLCAISKPSCFQ